MKIIEVDYERVRHLRPAGRKLGADISEGKRPLLWFALVDDYDEVVGCIGAYIQTRSARVRGWLVLPRFQNKGFGADLLAHLLGHLQSRGIKRVEMNTRHIRLAERFGFRSTGVKYSGSTWFKGYGEKLERKL